MNSTTQINTTEAKRISKRLINHWKHKFEVAETETNSKIFMPTATVTLSPHEQHLDVLIENQQEDVAHLEQVVLAHLNRMAGQEFSVEWTHH
ncbi:MULTISPECIES: DUF2218 domain-containing protein [unclassified Acinetobacter]|uniref:DUF2218 domain-containing protein n=1 Tax=unclassified Acinetobacter TaxID=196816 RepID=UPI00244A7EE7|nr:MULTISPECIES: DUF2218 domain-containing protein [unclassified Acinetobacter]MDH0030889.1 DUF2218 domain-containing protein [Acinetobacter sp. GD04021]MDH0886338.1 DUF2218 domain-containing protein [Acinetobacter sp. GD03873]MDH1082912.1 DUF2218 domain-containing protein [Acinetobacter sp. GD03983]MDH2189938.1 DUF2218 domain-containing protein [Acinetobacter sp. GD03645]MDH2203091.1 DUF2218 domain-containing protein [Acinetobacter sp. GD03647]